MKLQKLESKMWEVIGVTEAGKYYLHFFCQSKTDKEQMQVPRSQEQEDSARGKVIWAFQKSKSMVGAQTLCKCDKWTTQAMDSGTETKAVETFGFLWFNGVFFVIKRQKGKAQSCKYFVCRARVRARKNVC